MRGSLIGEPRCDKCFEEKLDKKLIFLLPERPPPRETRILKGRPRNAWLPSLRCLAEPRPEGYLGSYFFLRDFERSMIDGVMPSGSLWINDHTNEVFEVYGEDLKPQELLLVSPRQLKLLHSRYPRLERALSSPAVC
jgi:hypothetical protein